MKKEENKKQPPKDIFVDSNVAKNFTNPVDEHYKTFIRWLKEEGTLVLNNLLQSEYGRSNQNLAVLISFLTIKGRILRIENKDLTAFHFPKRIEKKLKSNREDREHLKTILLSHRKIALIIDNAFRNDVNNYPKYEGKKAEAVARPEQIDYKGRT